MARRDFLLTLRKQKVTESHITPRIDDQQELADAYRREIKNITDEILKHRQQAAKIEPKPVFDRLYGQPIHHTQAESRKVKEAIRRDEVHNVVYGYAPLSSLFPKKQKVINPKTTQRAASVPPLSKGFVA